MIRLIPKLFIPALIVLFNIYPVLAVPDLNGSEPLIELSAQHEGDHSTTAEHGDHDDAEHGDEEHGEEHEGGGHGGLEPILFVVFSLVIGAATRHFLKGSPIPFTVLLLIFGILLGVGARTGMFTGILEPFEKAIHWASLIDPHAILFIFLPILIFEAAFAMDVHTFKKIFANATILAVPGIILALVATGAMVIAIDMYGLGMHDWGWPIALMFGSVISATDPVAVVALLKDLGASKKLGTLIEGESLLNDGTAIVIFMVFLSGITAAAIDSPVMEFFKVAIGGTLLGIIIGGVTIAWVKRVFNDALVEITVIIAAAYLTFYIAEDFMHVSGVLGLVALGLAMAGVGRTRISPEVEHFLHEFWELAAFMANVLIFIIVGVVIAERTVFTANDFLLLGIIYIGIHIIRGAMIVMFYPVMKRIGYGLAPKDAIVLWYGALRGAIGLALALVVAGVDDQYISAEIKNQFLFLIAGTVTLTLLVNATTIPYLVRGLGLTRIPAVKALMMANAFDDLKLDTENEMELMKGEKFLSGANWTTVQEYLPDFEMTKLGDEEKAAMDTLSESRRRILQKEQSSYWSQFKNGLLGPTAVRRLSDGISEVLDDGGKKPLTNRPYMDLLLGTPKFLTSLETMPVIGALVKRSLSDRLAMSYDIAKGFVVAQEEINKLIDSMVPDSETTNKDIVTTIMAEVDENRMSGLNFLQSTREAHPEIAAAIETKQAIRSVLNHERGTIKKLQGEGRIESDEAEKLIISVEGKMKKLNDSPPSIKLPEPVEILKQATFLKDLDEVALSNVLDIAEKKTYPQGKNLVETGGPGDGMFLIARGAVKVIVGDGIVIDILGPGSISGEMAVLTGVPRTATVQADSLVTAMWLGTEGMQHAMQNSSELEGRLWRLAGLRFAENMIGKSEPYNEWPQIELRRWLAEGVVSSVENGSK
ncbi:MAG: cation:proton antiporter, partial [Bacteroidetes bacterium]|nr:cation:proton antiporter [Bacteroidota bacterium]